MVPNIDTAPATGPSEFPVSAEGGPGVKARLAALVRALGRGQPRPWVQPVLDGEGALVVVEVTGRVEEPGTGWISLGAFRPVAARHGLLGALRQPVLAAACALAGGLARRGLAVPVTFDLTGADLRDHGLVREIDAAIARAGLPPGRIGVEVAAVTLATALAPPPALAELRGIGLRLVLDDMPSDGPRTALALAPDMVKIDRLSTCLALHDPAEQTRLTSLARAAARAGARVIAKGIDTPRQARLVEDAGCHAFQGPLIAPLMTADAFDRWLDADRDARPAQAA